MTFFFSPSPNKPFSVSVLTRGTSVFLAVEEGTGGRTLDINKISNSLNHLRSLPDCSYDKPLLQALGGISK